MELQGCRVVRVTGGVAELRTELAPDRRTRRGVCDAGIGGGTGILGGSGGFAMSLCGGIPVTLSYAPRRVQCARCGGVHVEALPWAVGQQRFTPALLVTIATWTRVLPWQQVAVLFGCAWGTVERAVEAAVVYGLAHRDLRAVTHIGIDEVSRKKGHVYVTNV